MIHILCFEPHLKVAISAENINLKEIFDKEINHVNAIDLKIAGEGIDAAKILPKMGIPSIMISLISSEDRKIFFEKISNEKIELIEIITNSISKIDVEIKSNSKKKIFLPPITSHTNKSDELISEVKKLNKYDVLIIPGETDYNLMYSICQICSDNMVSFYFDYKDYYSPEILENNPFLVSMSVKQISKITGEKIDQSNIFSSMESLVDLGAENIIVVWNNTIFLKFKSHLFSTFCEGFTEMNQSINKEMLISSFIGLLSSQPDPKKAIYEAISIVRDFTFNISLKFSNKIDKINDLFKNDNFENNFKLNLSVYKNTKEILFTISKELISSDFIKKKIEEKISIFFQTIYVRERESIENYYFHIKLKNNYERIDDLARLENIVENNKENFFKIIIDNLKK